MTNNKINYEDGYQDMPTGFIKSLYKAMCVLECFTQNEPVLTLHQISQRFDMPKSTLLNFLKTLTQLGYLERMTGTQRYCIGYKSMIMDYVYHVANPALEEIRPFLANIQEKTGEIVYLTTHINGEILYLDSIYPQRTVNTKHSDVGKILPIHCTGCGKAMLAYLPDNEIDSIIKKRGLVQCTFNTITDLESLKKEIALIKKRTYAIDNEEETVGIKCIAMPILNSNNYPTGAISISGTINSMKDELLPQYADLLTRTCHAVEIYANQLPAGKYWLARQIIGEES